MRKLLVILLALCSSICFGQATGFINSNNQRVDGLQRAQVVGSGDPTASPIPFAQSVTRDANNTIVAQLASAATFTGACTSVLNYRSYQVSIVTDQAGTLILDQFKSATCTGTADLSTTLTVPASTPTSPLMALTFQLINENARIRFTNNGGSTTTTLSVTADLCPICSTQTAFPPITSSQFSGNPLSPGAPINEKGGRWGISNVSAGGAQGTASKAAGGGTVRHIVDCISFSADSSAAVTASNVTLNVRDGATGAGTAIWSYALSFPTVAALGVQEVAPHSLCGLNLIGTANTAMTIEFSAAVTGSIQAVNASGYDVP